MTTDTSYQLDMSRRAMRSSSVIASWKYGLVLVTLDVIALCLAAILAADLTLAIEQYVLKTSLYTSHVDIAAAHRSIYSVLCLVILAMFWSKGVYTERRPWWSQVQFIGKVLFFVFLIDGFISFSLKIYESRMLIGLSWAMAFAFILTGRLLACRVVARLGWWKMPTVVIGDNNTVSDLIYAFSADPCTGYDVHTVFLRDRDNENFDIASLPRECRNVRIRNDLTGYESYIQNNPDSFYVVSLDAFRGEDREQLMSTLENAKVRYAIVPTTARAGLYHMEPRYFFGHDIMMMETRRIGGNVAFSFGQVIKRAMDIAISGLALLSLLPLFAIVALMLKVEGQNGTVFYDGKRIGRNGRYFSCWKFRSMEPDSDHLLHAYLEANPKAKAAWEKYRKLPNDPRITTKTARFIRKASIDELPQLWNVFVGDMSLVGPRPILEDEQSYFGDTMKEYLSVRPGLTGLWQVSGRNATSFKRRVYWDSWYVRNWSLWGDIVILIKTPLVLLSRKGAN